MEGTAARCAVYHCQIFLAPAVLPDLGGQPSGSLTGTCQNHDTAYHTVQTMHGADTGLGISQFPAYQLRQSAGFIGGQDASGLDSNQYAVVLIQNFHFRDLWFQKSKFIIA